MTLSKYVIKIFGEIGSPCLVPIVVVNHSPTSCPNLYCHFDLSPISLRICTNLLPTPYDLSVAQIISNLIESNAFWKSTKQLYTILLFLDAFSAINLNSKICCIVLLSLLNPACSSAMYSSVYTFSLFRSIDIRIFFSHVTCQSYGPIAFTFCQVTFL